MSESKARAAHFAAHGFEPEWAAVGVKSAGRPKRWQAEVAVGFGHWVRRILELGPIADPGPRQNRLDRRTEASRDNRAHSLAVIRIRARHLSRVAKVNAYYVKTHGPFRRHAILRRQTTSGVTF